MQEMNVNKMTKKELLELENFKPTKDFNAIVILPNQYKHDSGYRCMEFILCDGLEIVGKVGGGSDIIHINGVGGYGDWLNKYTTLPNLVKPVGWSIDCLYKNHLLRIFIRGNEKLKINDFIGSDFEIFVKE